MKTILKTERVISSEVACHAGEEITVSGWLHKKRELGGVTFLVLRDRRGLVQVLVEESSEREKLRALRAGSVLTLTGMVVEDKRSVGGAELHGPKIKVEVPVEFASPIEIDKVVDHRPETLGALLEWRVLNIRNLAEMGLWRIQAAIGDAIREFLCANEFVEFHSPKLLAGSTEGGAEVFKLDYFGQQATLAQSAQFYKQIMVGSLERVFEFGGTYRAEPSTTTRHMSEFVTVDVEIGFINGMPELLELMSGMINHACETLWQKHERELLALKATRPVLAERFPEITVSELHELVYRETAQDFRQEKDPAPFEERWICEHSAKQWGSEAVFITEFPASGMKFYHYRSETNPEVAERADLIFRGVEIITGSRREHRYHKLIQQLKAMGGDTENPGFKYYLQAFQYGMPSHGGFGLGLERLTQRIIGFRNVKEATLFPRDTSRLAP
jgi:nondiscriminating aspartyl-tRNA synthetase